MEMRDKGAVRKVSTSKVENIVSDDEDN